MRKIKLLSSFLIVAFFVSCINFDPGSRHFIQLGNEGAWAAPITSTVVNQAYDISGNGGRKLVRLSNGWLVCCVNNSFNYIFYKSSDNGLTWSQLCYASMNSIQSYAITSIGTMVHFLLTDFNNQRIIFDNFDATTVTNTNILGTNSFVTVDSSQTSQSGCSITVDSSGTLHAAWASKNSTYPESFNIRYSKSTDGGVIWSTPSQLSNDNTTYYNSRNPSIVSNGNNIFIMFQYDNTYNNIHQILYHKYNGSSWSNFNTIYNGGSYVQSNPCSVVSPDGTVHVVWHGIDSTDNSAYNIRYSKSTDNGSSWSAMQKITSGNLFGNGYPSIATDKNNNVFIEWSGGSSSNQTYSQIRRIIFSVNWGAIQDLTNQTSGDALYPSLCSNYKDFIDPLCIYKDNQAGAIKFRGDMTQPPSINQSTPSQNGTLFSNYKTLERSA